MTRARLGTFFARNSLWLVSLAIMAASSGIDGAYMARWMPVGLAVLGYALNTATDVATQVLVYWFGRLQQEPRNSKRWRLSWFILPAEFVSVAFAWFFGWRQLLLVLPAIEGAAAVWVAPIAALFVPCTLAAVAYTQSVIAGRLDADAQPDADVAQARAELRKANAELAQLRATDAQSAQLTADLAQARAELARHHERPAPTFEDFAQVLRDWRSNGSNGAQPDASVAQLELVRAGFAPIPGSTARSWLGRMDE